MIITYGDYEFENQEATRKSTVKVSQRSRRDRRNMLRVRWGIEGFFQADTEAALIAKKDALEAALAVDGRDLKLKYPDDGAVADALYSSQTIGGVRCVQLAFPKGEGVEWVAATGAGGLTFNFVMEGVINENAEELLFYTETLSRIGTGAGEFGYLGVVNGPPQYQDLSLATTYQVVQAGRAVGFSGYPVAPTPVDIPATHGRTATATLGTPDFIGADQINYPIRWRYHMENINPINGTFYYV